jgi:hypothetical protein
MTADSYPDNRASEPRVLETGYQDSQYAPTPGYHGCMQRQAVDLALPPTITPSII